MVSTNELKKGMSIIIDGQLYEVIYFQHVKPGKGGAFVRTKLRNILADSVIEKTFRAGENFEHAYIETCTMQYLYKDGDSYWFMDTASYEQYPVNSNFLGDAVLFLKEETMVKIKFHEKKIIGIEMPSSVELKIVQTDPGFKGDTVSGGTKPATLETGAVVQVPLFIKEDEVIKVNVETKEYIGRA